MMPMQCYKSRRSCEGLTKRRASVRNARQRTSGRFRLSIAASLALLLGGCSTTSTPYQPVSTSNRVSGGYSEVRLEADRYRVTFSGNMFTSRDKVEGYLLYRAAELTTQQGYDWFVIRQRETEHLVERRVEPDPMYRPWYGSSYGYWQPQWRYYDPMDGWRNWHADRGDPFWADGMDVTTVEQFEATAEIKMRRGEISKTNRRAFDARDVLRNLRPAIERPQP